MISCVPRPFSTRSVVRRISRSEVPPGVNGLITRIGRSGHLPCANTGAASAHDSATINDLLAKRMGCISWERFG